MVKIIVNKTLILFRLISNKHILFETNRRKRTCEDLIYWGSDRFSVFNFFIYTKPTHLFGTTKGPGCPSGYDAGLTNHTSLVRFLSPLNSSFHVIRIRSPSGSEPTIIWRSHYNISKMVLYCREVSVWCRTGFSSMGPLCGLRLGQNGSLTLNDNLPLT